MEGANSNTAKAFKMEPSPIYNEKHRHTPVMPATWKLDIRRIVV
jgi:hypothetical protein